MSKSSSSSDDSFASAPESPTSDTESFETARSQRSQRRTKRKTRKPKVTFSPNTKRSSLSPSPSSLRETSSLLSAPESVVDIDSDDSAIHAPVEASLNPPAVPRQASRPPRLASLDILRGAAILGMIVANFQIQDRAFPILLHPEWIGLSLADLVFPSFLFIMGASIPLSMKSHKRSYASILERSLKLILLGMLLNAPFTTSIDTFRFAGVLQRTGIVFGVTASAYKLIRSPVAFNFLLPTTLLTLWFLLSFAFTPAPGSTPFPDLPSCPNATEHGFSSFSPPHCTAQSYLDNLLLGGRSHLYRGLPFDPEGVLSTLTACMTCIVGVVIGTSLQRAMQRDLSDGKWRWRLVVRLFVQGFVSALVAVGILVMGVPVSKNLWSPSFVGVCVAVGCIALSGVFWAVDCGTDVVGEHARLLGAREHRGDRAPESSPTNKNAIWSTLASCGKNPLTLYVAHEVVVIVLVKLNWYGPIFEALFGWIRTPKGIASLLWSLFWAVGIVAPFGVYLDEVGWYWRL
ncbi:hypothetical protein HDU98_011235 [Podochytrium sp. JEL0797]|nr:hypothetical protein HDU98_011235 [Podochytrium sp. JEL0797]